MGSYDCKSAVVEPIKKRSSCRDVSLLFLNFNSFFSKLPCYGGWRILVEEYHSSKGRICSVQTVAHLLNLPVLKTHFGITPALWLKVKVACFLPLAELFCLNPYRWLCGSAFNRLTASSISSCNSALNDSLWIEPHRVSAVSFPQHAITILI